MKEYFELPLRVEIWISVSIWMSVMLYLVRECAKDIKEGGKYF